MSYKCENCGYESLKWSGKCPSCGEWDTLKLSASDERSSKNRGKKRAKPAKVSSLKSGKNRGKTTRISSAIGEIDRVLGGGLVPGQVVLLSGEPGIGKSTLLLQMCICFKKKVLYVSGEESLDQLKSRLERVNSDDNLKISVTENTDVDQVISAIEEEKPQLIVVDSIQSLSTSDVSGYAGSVSQVRECGMRLTRAAKHFKVPLFMIGQVTKEGSVAGPKVLEHVVDTVLHFEGDEFGLFRILRGVKNRFGATDEVGIFEMMEKGLKEVLDPSVMLDSDSKKNTVGVARSAVYKGSRVLVVEIQALTSPAAFGSPRRLPTGFSKARLEMLCAVLTRRASINLGGDDVFVNIMGGLNLKDPSIDLAVCMAIASAKKDKKLSEKVFIGEVGLSGEVREVSFQEKMETEMKRRKLDYISSSKLRVKKLSSALKSEF
jgi:DNA repair protein RadA/Sms